MITFYIRLGLTGIRWRTNQIKLFFRLFDGKSTTQSANDI